MRLTLEYVETLLLNWPDLPGTDLRVIHKNLRTYWRFNDELAKRRAERGIDDLPCDLGAALDRIARGLPADLPANDDKPRYRLGPKSRAY